MDQVKTDDVLMVIECPLPELRGKNQSEKPQIDLIIAEEEDLQVTSRKSQQRIPLHMCPLDLPRRGLSICTGPVYNLSSLSILSWVEYHRMLGVEHIYLYDRKGQYEELLGPLISQDAVTVIPWSAHCGEETCHESQGKYFDQYGALNSCLMRYGPASRWIAHTDVDEYFYMAPDLRAQHAQDLKHWLRHVEFLFPQVAEVRCASIQHYSTPDTSDENKSGLISSLALPSIESFTEREAFSVIGYNMKYFARSGLVNVMGVHRVESFREPPARGRTVLPPETDLRINHYRSGQKKLLPRNLLLWIRDLFLAKRIPAESAGWVLENLKARVQHTLSAPTMSATTLDHKRNCDKS